MIKMWNVFHYFHTENLVEIQNYERLLLQLSSEYLQRRIHLVPYLETECDIFMEPEYSTANGEFKPTRDASKIVAIECGCTCMILSSQNIGSRRR